MKQPIRVLVAKADPSRNSRLFKDGKGSAFFSALFKDKDKDKNGSLEPLNAGQQLGMLKRFANSNSREFAVERTFNDEASYDDLSDKSGSYEPHILHFLAHGEPKNIVLVITEMKEAKLVPIKKIVDLIHRRPSIRMVLFNCCYSAGWLDAVLEGNPNLYCAIGWPGEVAYGRTTDFSKKFYEGLLQGETLSVAFKEAEAVLLDDPELIGLVAESTDVRFKNPRIKWANEEVKNLYWQDLAKDSVPILQQDNKQAQDLAKKPVPVLQQNNKRAQDQDPLKEVLQDLCPLINRPEAAFTHVIKEMEEYKKKRRPLVKACLYFFNDNHEDEPLKFADGLALRLSGSSWDKPGADIMKIIDEGNCERSEAEFIEEHLEKGQYDSFRDHCYRQVLGCLKLPTLEIENDYSLGQASEANKSFDKYKNVRRDITRSLRNRAKEDGIAQVIGITLVPRSVNRPVNRPVNRLSSFVAWLSKLYSKNVWPPNLDKYIQDWNEEWDDMKMQNDVAMTPLSLLFLVEKPTDMKAKQDACSCLERIEEHWVDRWFTLVRNTLSEYCNIPRKRLDVYAKGFNALVKKSAYPVTYRDFANYCQQIKPYD